jgi:hypothetical protein
MSSFCSIAIDPAEPYRSDMPTIALQAHYDGERIVLDEPFDLPVNASLIVTVLPAMSDAELDSERIWLRAAASSDAFAFLADPAEDVYTATDGEPFVDAL